MSERTVVGVCPWLPWPLSCWPWWTEPVRAERLAALRVGVSALLLLDVLTTYLPRVFDFFGGESLGSPEVFAYWMREPRWHWSILSGVEDQQVLQTFMIVWVIAIIGLLLGFCTRLSAVAVWVLSTSFATLNPYIDNAGDEVRGIILFYLMLCPCGAVWSLDRRLAPWGKRLPGPIYVHPWPLRLLFVQMTFIYFSNGFFKLQGRDWRNGTSLYYVLSDLTLARWSYAQFPMPLWLTQLLSWSVLVWELAFPVSMILPWFGQVMFQWLFLPERIKTVLMAILRWQRVIALFFGAMFHVGILVSLEIGLFAPYMLCLYLPLLPWERWTENDTVTR